MLKIAIIGLGVIGRHHLEKALPLAGVEVNAVCDLHGELAQTLAKEHNIGTWTASPGEIFANPHIDAVVLALPTGCRTALAIEALRAGKHVLLEKPAAMNLAEIDSMLALQKDLVVACCSSRFRSLPSAQKARECIATGKLGTIHTIGCRVLKPAGPRPANPPPAWRLNMALNGGGVMANWGYYDLDYLLGLFDFKLQPEHVFARTWTIAPPYTENVAPDSDAEAHLAAMVTFRNGTVLQYERCEYGTLPASASWTIAGDLGSLTLNMRPVKKDNIILGKADAEKGTQFTSLCSEDETAFDYNAMPITDFAHAIINRREPMTSLENARMLTMLTDAMYASADSGTPQTLA